MYAGKHLDAIFNAVKHSPSYPQVESEPLRGRIKDAINYLVILEALMVEDDALRPGQIVPIPQGVDARDYLKQLVSGQSEMKVGPDGSFPNAQVGPTYLRVKGEQI